MRFDAFVLAFLLAGCRTAGPAAITHEQAQVLQATVVDITPAILGRMPDRPSRRRMAKGLKRLQTAIARGTAEEVLDATAEVRQAAGSTLDDALALVLSQADTAVRVSLTPRRPK